MAKTAAGLLPTERLADVCRRIARAATDCGRDPAEVTLVAVSKTFAGADILPVIAAGQRVFGENRVQESWAKWPDLRRKAGERGGRPIELHLIGPLQSNKAKDAIELFDVIQTIDRAKIAATLAAEMAKLGKYPQLYVQINTGAEPQKAGVNPEHADAFIKTCRLTHGLVIEGLMCIPPVSGQVSPHFALLSQIAKRNGLFKLSMGMSSDYELAIQLGATHVRVGSAIFGERS